jgi:hypothetical protein
MAEPTPAAAPQDKIATMGDLHALVVKRSGLSPDYDLQEGQSCKWLGREDLVVGKPSPFNVKFIVVALYHDAMEIRCYEAPGKDAEGLYPRRLTLTKTVETIFTETMSIRRFAELLAEELALLDDEVTSAERERASVLAYIETCHPGTTVRTLAQDLIEEKHLEEEDEEGEPEEEETPNGAAAPSPSP